MNSAINILFWSYILNQCLKDGVSHLGHLPTELKGNVGENGAKCNMTGKCAEHVFIDVPLGTMIKQPETNELLADLATDGLSFNKSRFKTFNV